MNSSHSGYSWLAPAPLWPAARGDRSSAGYCLARCSAPSRSSSSPSCRRSSRPSTRHLSRPTRNARSAPSKSDARRSSASTAAVTWRHMTRLCASLEVRKVLPWLLRQRLATGGVCFHYSTVGPILMRSTAKEGPRSMSPNHGRTNRSPTCCDRKAPNPCPMTDTHHPAPPRPGEGAAFPVNSLE
ncbi:hypothetical protein ebA7085 [Aromatoleum aromaticum EbN1]|uniref:Uncharacterized protein n=1 Tax=Aromatoleum aromaticum (strain DSM 19018 / LMG 30748 / EbN1) TaxID=76114 RepID=Q5NXS0_AROAE|nr:hypothetical protein ebA7085 [Aromatoleum aromaticum EbN1]